MTTQQESDAPIFILGAPRSGTSLLRIMLNRHARIGLCDETYFFFYVYTRRKAFGDLKDAQARHRLILSYLATNRISELGLNKNALVDTLMDEGNTYESLFLSLLRFYAKAHGKQRFGEKTPQHSLEASTLSEWYPLGKQIHIIRDPRDVVASLLRMSWGSKSVTANARNWLEHMRGISQVTNRKNCLVVFYEKLVSDPENELIRLCEFVGEDYSRVMLDPEKELEKHVVPDKWWFQRAKGPVSSDRIGKWREDLTPEQVGLVEWIAGPVMQQFGYDLSYPHLSFLDKSQALAMEVLDTVHWKVTRPAYFWYHWIQPTKLVQEERWIDHRT